MNLSPISSDTMLVRHAGENSWFARCMLQGLLCFYCSVRLLSHCQFLLTGTFINDTDLQYFTFTLLNDTPGVALRTWSYSGGTNAAGRRFRAGDLSRS